MEENRPRTAIVDDDEEILESLARYLTNRGCVVTTAQSGVELDAAMAHQTFDVVVLDLMLPGEDGLSICRRMPANLPVIMLSAIGGTTDRIVGLEMGAWDYLPKPFDPRELLARIKALARRRSVTQMEQADRQVVAFTGWTFNLSEQKLADEDGRPVPLSGAEFRLLEAFVRSPGRLLSRDFLLATTHGENTDVFDRVIDVSVSRLRKKLSQRGFEAIETVRGEGYRFALPVRKL